MQSKIVKFVKAESNMEIAREWEEEVKRCVKGTKFQLCKSEFWRSNAQCGDDNSCCVIYLKFAKSIDIKYFHHTHIYTQ